ncbi:MAG: SpoIIE family protein phosphatase [Ignavibacteriae bacterium]|nr:SpoIIE family protein phosphatase [Ignavibacteriota bacterium]MCB9260021.1 SpoIIE family protein phosphatase [Ignavibacteriales bacterium]
MKNKLIFLALLLISYQIIGQPIKNKFIHFTEKDGISSNEVNSIIQDHLGYIWIGTSNGVTKYDGYEFVNFTIVPNDTNFLQLPLISSLYEDSKGNIWIGSVDGVTKYDRDNESFKLFSLSPFGLKQERTLLVTSMQETLEGNILCSVRDFYWNDLKNALYLIDTKNNLIEENSISNMDSTDTIFDIKFAGHNQFFIAGWKGFAKYDLNKNVLNWYPFKKHIPVISLLKNDNDKLWLGTWGNGLIEYNLNDSTYADFASVNSLNSDSPLGIMKMVYDQKKNLLLATNKGLIHFNTLTNNISISEIDTKNPSALHSINLNDIYIDNSGSIWIATNGAGVSKYDILKNNFRAYISKVDDKNSIPPGWVSAIFEFKENELWLKSNRGTLIKFNPQTEIFKRETIPNNFEIFEILKTSTGKILLVGGGAVYKLDPQKWIFERLLLPEELNNNVILSALEVNSNTIWFGSSNGLYIYDQKNSATTKIDFKTLGIGDSYTNQIDILIKDKNGNIWMGSADGLLKYDINKKLYSRIGFSSDQSKSLTTQDINSIYVDEDNNLWIGTWLGGLNKYDQNSGTFEHFTQTDGLPSHSVQGILGDEENGYLWLSTFNGISRFNINEKSFSNFGIDDGIHANQFADGAALKTSKGQLIFGGSNGMTVFNPKDIQNNLIPPKITITDFKLFSKSILPGTNSLLKKPIYEIKNLTLNHDENDIQFDYFAVHYVDPQKNQYAYKLENYEDEWRYVGNQRSAIYPNLPPGEYVFHLKASNNNDVWNEEGVSLNIKILPPWWKTIWAYILYFLLFLFGVYIIDRVQRKRLLLKERTASAMKEAELRAVAAEAQSRVIQAENDRKSKELEEARQLQLSMLPKDLPQIPNLDIAVYMKTATEVGGDYYDFHVAIDGTLTVVVGDATGHGMKAGTMVTTAKTLFNSYAKNPDILLTFSEMTNCIKQMKMDHLSMCMTMLKIKENKIYMSSAGMPPLYIYRHKNNELEEFEMKGMPLGTFINFPYKVNETNFEKGDALILLSDGLPELISQENEIFGYDRIDKILKEVGNLSSENILDVLKKSSFEWLNGNDQDDDITFIAIKNN